MGAGVRFESPVELPAGYVAIGLTDPPREGAAPPVRLSIVACTKADDLGGQLILLRDTLDAQVFLGCIQDAAGHIVPGGWVEIWVQNLEGFSRSSASSREALSNAALDRRWSEVFKALDAREPGAMITTGWEAQHPLPTLVDVKRKTIVNPVDRKTSHPWQLCTDNALLESKGLPAYSTSLARYLYIKEGGSVAALAAVTHDSPTNEHALPLEQALYDISGIEPDELAPLNAGGGLMMVRAFSPVSYEQFVDILGGGPWTGVQHGRIAIAWERKHNGALQPEPAAASASSDGSLFLDRHGKWGRLVEALHLKLRLWSQAVELCRAITSQSQRPLLNVSPESFQVRLGEGGGGLPHLWTARLALNDPGDAIVLPIAAADAQYCVRGGGARVSIYQPDSAAGSTGGRAALRIRQILPDTAAGTIIEGTLRSNERLTSAQNDLLWIRLTIAGERVDLYSRLEADAALATGEVRFRTVPQRFGEQLLKSIRAAEGVPINNVNFEIVPYWSTPCDLYALAVLGVRTLLVDADNSLPVALDEVMSLAQQIAQEHDADVGMGLRIQSLFDRDTRWGQSLGPQRLVLEQVSSAEAFDLIPPDLWWEVLAVLVRMFPGVGPDSIAADLGDAPSGGIHKVFNPVVEALDRLLVRTRSLIVIDWRANREIHAVIRRLATGLHAKT